MSKCYLTVMQESCGNVLSSSKQHIIIRFLNWLEIYMKSIYTLLAKKSVLNWFNWESISS